MKRLYAAFATLLAATAIASASPLPTATDEARALAGARIARGSVAVATTATPTATDQARAGARAVASEDCSCATRLHPTTSDEARVASRQCTIPMIGMAGH